MNILTAILFLLGTSFGQDPVSNQFIDVLGGSKGIHIKSSVNTNSCNNKAYLPISIPENAKGIIYSLRTVKKSEYKAEDPWLFSELESWSDRYEADRIPEYLVPQSNNRNFNFYLITGTENAQSFNNCGRYEYQEKHINSKSRVAYIDVSGWGDEPIYICIENNTALKHLRLLVEVVAIVE